MTNKIVDASKSEWYQKKRAMVRDAFRIGKPKHYLSKTIESPSGKYSIEKTPFEITKNGWDYCEARFYNNLDDEYILSVYRNYGTFPYCWLEGHPMGDFVICGEDYQGLTLVDLIGGRTTSFISDSAQQGNGFCAASFDVSPEMNRLAIEGCYWGGPYELMVLEIPLKAPMQFPWKPIYNDYIDFRNEEGNFETCTVIGWEDNNTILIEAELEFADPNGEETCDDKEFRLRDTGMDFDEVFHEVYNFHYKRTRTYALDIGSGKRKVIDEIWNEERWNDQDS